MANKPGLSILFMSSITFSRPGIRTSATTPRSKRRRTMRMI